MHVVPVGGSRPGQADVQLLMSPGEAPDPMLSTMDGLQQLGARFRAVRIRRAWRQEDLARRVGVDRSTISRIERGHLEGTTIGTLLKLARALDIQLTFVTRSRGADLDRLVHGRHAGMHESVLRWFGKHGTDWQLESEVSFAIAGERGVIDILGWHAGRRALVIIELKTDLVDLGDLLAQMDRRRRLARRIAAERGWDPVTISV
jgi:transcriptional regulator with XRE-family HTH domain